MHIEVLENEKEKLKIEIPKINAGLTQLIAKTGWEIGGQIAAVQEHPFTEQPKLISIGANAKKNLEKSTSKVLKDLTDLEAQMTRLLKK